MMNRRFLLTSIVSAAALTTIQPVMASEKLPFTQAAFDAVVKAGRPVLVEVHAPWCPTCKAQRPILSELTSQPRFKNLVVYEIDFDSQKDALRALRVQTQSTLIVFKGGSEVGRSVGDTNPSSIAALVARTI